MNVGYHSGGGNQQMVSQPMVVQNQQMNNPQMMGQPMQPVYVPMPMGQYFFVTDPLAELMNAKKASVKQRFELFETLTGCETPNQYYVYTEDQEGNKKYLFKAKEHSSCCCRLFCTGNSREFDLNFRRITYISQGQEKKIDFAKFKRPFKCTCCCCNRPEMSGNFEGERTGYIGKISEPCTLCDPKIHISNSSNVIVYTISCNCCQCGYYCRNNWMGRCSEVDFSIYKGSSIDGQPVGNIHKKFKGCTSLIGDADAFKLTFPVDAAPEEKFLLISATVMLDYLYYEDKNDGKQA